MRVEWRYRSALGILLVALLALGLRLYRFEAPGLSGLQALHTGTLPPGLHWDEAFNTLAALRLVRGGSVEPFIRVDLGRMPLHIFLTTLVFAVTGPLTVGGRIAALLPNLLSLLLTLPLVRVIFRDDLERRTQFQLAWILALQISVTYWFVHFSRIGMEHTTLVFYSMLAMWGLWWALRHVSAWRVGVAGGLLGLAIYTYPAAYALPIAVLGILLHFAFTQHLSYKQAGRWALSYGLGFAIVLLPLALFFARYPEWLVNRPASVRVTTVVAMIQNTWKAFAGLVWIGDYNTSYNLPNRPFFDIVQTGFFVIGLVVCVRRFRRLAYAFNLIWLGVMLLPQILSEAPHFGRIAGATLPAVFVAAIGGLTAWQFIAQRSILWARLMLVGATLFSAGLTVRDYFVRWPQTPDLYATFRVAERLEAESVRQTTPQMGERLYLSPVNHDMPVIRYILDDRPDDFLAFFNGRVCTVMPPAGQAAHYWLTAYEDADTLERLTQVFGADLHTQSDSAPGHPLMTQVSIPARRAPTLPQASTLIAPQRVGGLMQPLAVVLPSANFSATVTDLPLTLIWQVTNETIEDLTLGLYLLGPDYPNAGFQLMGQVDRQPCDNAYPTSRWRNGEWVMEETHLQLPANLPAGRYTLALVLYHYPSLDRLPVTLLDGTPVGDLAELVDVNIVAP